MSDMALQSKDGVRDIGVQEAEAPLREVNIPPKEQCVEMYRWMVKIRAFDRRCVRLQRQGRIGTYAPLEGQEAAQVGSAFALDPGDMMFPTYRDHGAMAVHGVPLERILLYWNGRVEGTDYPQDVQVFPPAVPIGTQIPHAVGYAMARQYRGDTGIALGYFGDGATSEGDFHEGLNFAAVFRAPVVLFCQNNQYAISVPFSRQTATQTVAEKAAAYGIEGIRVDGNDLLAVYAATRHAVEKARRGEGPTLIEAYTYRVHSHTTADDHTRYRSAEEVEMWKSRDPVRRFRAFLEARRWWDDQSERALADEVEERVEQAVQAMEQWKAVNPADMFNHCFADLPDALREQEEELSEVLRGGDRA